jgi:hypothetical protein
VKIVPDTDTASLKNGQVKPLRSAIHFRVNCFRTIHHSLAYTKTVEEAQRGCPKALFLSSCAVYYARFGNAPITIDVLSFGGNEDEQALNPN